ncbi:hypothetical protein W822_12175 [Advenella kashmirensis W13003]|uniref:Uncharacterized protein n=1 Tax=Advenella kashmirensis W13003 TaxID=1424334 RepID=V8QSM3_9BURK|nr:hypothetical protein W822_12175 [Advenella kashmirensis W13003]
MEGQGAEPMVVGVAGCLRTLLEEDQERWKQIIDSNG